MDPLETALVGAKPSLCRSNSFNLSTTTTLYYLLSASCDQARGQELPTMVSLGACGH